MCPLNCAVNDGTIETFRRTDTTEPVQLPNMFAQEQNNSIKTTLPPRTLLGSPVAPLQTQPSYHIMKSLRTTLLRADPLCTRQATRAALLPTDQTGPNVGRGQLSAYVRIHHLTKVCAGLGLVEQSVNMRALPAHISNVNARQSGGNYIHVTTVTLCHRQRRTTSLKHHQSSTTVVRLPTTNQDEPTTSAGFGQHRLQESGKTAGWCELAGLTPRLHHIPVRNSINRLRPVQLRYLFSFKRRQNCQRFQQQRTQTYRSLSPTTSATKACTINWSCSHLRSAR